jgi:hypothetical protein
MEGGEGGRRGRSLCCSSYRYSYWTSSCRFHRLCADRHKLPFSERQRMSCIPTSWDYTWGKEVNKEKAEYILQEAGVRCRGREIDHSA